MTTKRLNHAFKLMDFLLDESVEYFNVSADQIKSKSRLQPNPWIRQLIMAMAYKYTTMGYADCAAYFGKDHATCIHACKRVQAMRDTKDRKLWPDISYFEGKCEILIDSVDNDENDPFNKELVVDFARAVKIRRDKIINELEEIINHDRVMEGYSRHKFKALLTNLRMCIKVE